MSFQLLVLKRKIEGILLSPFLLLGRLIALLKPLPGTYKVFFFFPFYHTGGAEKIHAQIARACGGKDCLIFFTRKSQNATFYEYFKSSGCTIKDISVFTDNKLIYFVNFIYRGIISSYINKQAQAPVVFNGHSNFAYKISPWIKKSITQIDLVHSLNTFSYIRIPFIPFYTKTVLISKVKLEAHKEFYKQKSIPDVFAGRFVYIPNAVVFPKRIVGNKDFHSFQVVFSGRNSPEKRLPLFLEIAAKMHHIEPAIRFCVIGDAGILAKAQAYSFIEFYGELKDSAVIHDIYFKSHMLLLTSSTEGFPLVVIEAMANGCAILATPVGDLPIHVQNGKQGYLFTEIADEQKIKEEAIRHILDLFKHHELLKKIAAANITYAQDNFSIEQFNAAYQSLIYS